MIRGTSGDLNCQININKHAQKIGSFMSPQTIHRSINEFHLNSHFDCFLRHTIIKENFPCTSTLCDLIFIEILAAGLLSFSRSVVNKVGEK